MRAPALLILVASAGSSYALAVRVDQLLVNRGLCDSRAQAKAAVKAGRVSIGGEAVSKPALLLEEDARVELAAASVAYVSRAGEKLQVAIDALGLDLSGAAVLDIGASTGGFTDCALQAGAESAVCVDVGHGQLHPSLQADARVTSFEGVNARALTADVLPRTTFDLVVVDVSFISLRLVLPAVWPLLEPSNPRSRLIALVKPQFEAGRQAVAKGRGVVRDARTHARVVRELTGFATAELPGCAVVGQFESPILGSDGNREFLLALAPAAHRVPLIGVPLGGDAPAADEGGDDGLTPMPRPTKESTAHSRASTFANEHSL